LSTQNTDITIADTLCYPYNQSKVNHGDSPPRTSKSGERMGREYAGSMEGREVPRGQVL
jgi:hypothetical protein